MRNEGIIKLSLTRGWIGDPAKLDDMPEDMRPSWKQGENTRVPNDPTCANLVFNRIPAQVMEAHEVAEIGEPLLEAVWLAGANAFEGDGWERRRLTPEQTARAVRELKKLKVSTREAAWLFGVVPSGWRNYKNGISNPTAFQLARAFSALVLLGQIGDEGRDGADFLVKAVAYGRAEATAEADSDDYFDYKWERHCAAEKVACRFFALSDKGQQRVLDALTLCELADAVNRSGSADKMWDEIEQQRFYEGRGYYNI